MKKIEILRIFLSIFIILIVSLFLARILNLRELDDVTPGIQCNSDLIAKSDILWIIPDFNNTSISDSPGWCNYIKSLNKTLGLHGIYHIYREFGSPINQEDLDKAINDFQSCVGERPTIFKAPQLYLSSRNRILLMGKKLEIKGRFNQLTHKSYHCSDTGVFPNFLIDMF